MGTQADCRSAYPAGRSLTLNCSSTRRLDGRQNDCVGSFLFVRKCYGCALSPTSTAWTSADHIHHIVIAHVKPRVPGATRSTVHARRRVFHMVCPTCATESLYFACSRLGALECYSAERLNLACDEGHLRRLSQLAGIVERYPRPEYGKSGGFAGLRVEMRLASPFTFARATSHFDNVQRCTT